MRFLSICLRPSLIVTSCQKFIKSMDDDYADELSSQVRKRSYKTRIFSHNINGETHPCGCRKFPLGGLPQVAGYLHKANKESSTIYVDTGDMLFQTTNLPPYYKNSHEF
jgi:hypothetical protein